MLYGLVRCLSRQSLYGVVYNLSHGMVALVYIIGALAMFLPRTATYLIALLPPPGSAYAYAGERINPAVGF